MLWNEFFVGGFLLPTSHGDFQLSFKSVHESNDIVAAFERRIPSNTVDNVCKLLRLGQYLVSNDLPPAGRNLFSPALGSYSGEALR
jgi:hypothetical protein